MSQFIENIRQHAVRVSQCNLEIGQHAVKSEPISGEYRAICCKVSEPILSRKCPGYDRKLLPDIELITEEMCNT